MKPYYEHGGVTIYHGDCRELLLAIEPSDVSLVATDPPYGVAERTDRKAKGRGGPGRGALKSGAWEARDYPPVYGDDRPFDPSHLFRFKRLVLFGANHFAARLPTSPSWIVWDKRDGIGSNDNADCEIAWSNIGGPARLFSHRWSGVIRASEANERRVHPTQKPVALMSWIIGQWTMLGETVLDPYMGSGTTLLACKNLARRSIGIEIEERYCEVAARRLSQEVLPGMALGTPEAAR